jgi:hypothetical protein
VSCSTPSSTVAFATSSAALDLVVAGDSFSVATADGQVLADDALITTSPPETLNGPRWFVWEVLELDGLVAFGISDGSAGPIIRAGAVNLYYLSDGRMVVNGVVDRVVGPIVEGDVIGLYLDVAEGVAQFTRNGVPV